MPHDIFISYSSHDKVVADATCAALEAQKIRCWIAPRDVLAGTEYGEAILSAIEDCRAMVLVFSAHANESPHIRREVERAVSKVKIILPFRIENVLPSRAMEYCLGNTHWLDALTPPLETRIEELVATVRRLLARGTSSTPSPQPVTPQTPTQTQSEIAPASDGVPVGSEQAPKKLNARQRDALRAERNKAVVTALKNHAGIADCWVMQLEDHSDKGYLISVRFESRLCAAEVLALVRQVFNECLPDVPIWGEAKTETDDLVAFAFTYLDEHNKLFTPATTQPSVSVPLSRRTEVLAEAKRLLEQSDEIFADAKSAGGFEQGDQKLRFWKQRVIRFLDANFSHEDVALFAQLRSAAGYGNNMEHLTSSYMAHRGFLEGLVEQVEADAMYPMSLVSRPSGKQLPNVSAFSYKTG